MNCLAWCQQTRLKVKFGWPTPKYPVHHKPPGPVTCISNVHLRCKWPMGSNHYHRLKSTSHNLHCKSSHRRTNRSTQDANNRSLATVLDQWCHHRWCGEHCNYHWIQQEPLPLRWHNWILSKGLRFVKLINFPPRCLRMPSPQCLVDSVHSCYPKTPMFRNVMDYADRLSHRLC